MSVEDRRAERPTVLAVDDEPNNLELVQRALNHRYTVLTAQSGEEAVQLLERHQVICVLTDQKMPGMSGAELLRICRERQPDSVRVLLTGYSDIDSVIAAINGGQVSSYVRKPYHADELVRVVVEAHQLYTVTRKNRLLVEDLERRNAELDRQQRLLARTLEQRTQQLGAMEEKLGALSTRDPLTGLGNLRHFHEALGRVLRETPSGPVSVLVLDLDGFGRYNEVAGTAAGDELLVRVGSYLEEAIEALAKGAGPQAFVLARLGGDQFGAGFRADATSVEPVAARLQKVVSSVEMGGADGEAAPVTACVGLAELPTDAAGRAELVRCALRAVHAAKRRGPGSRVRHGGAS